MKAVAIELRQPKGRMHDTYSTSLAEVLCDVMSTQVLAAPAPGSKQHGAGRYSDCTGKGSRSDEVSRPVQTSRSYTVGQGDDFVERMRIW